MDEKIHFSIFSQAEEPAYAWFQRARDRFFAPLCPVLTKVGIKADYLTYLNFLLATGLVYFFTTFPYVSLVFLLLSILFDSLDGCLARYQKSTTQRGALLDIAVDHWFLFVVVFTFVATKTVDGFWGGIYAFNYLLMIILVLILRSLNMHVFPIVRSKYYLYLFWIFFLFTGLNYLDVFLVFFTVYMFFTNLLLFNTLRCSLR